MPPHSVHSGTSSPITDRRVTVVGAGPAGVAAAITLARAGSLVTVVDKSRFPRDKCCGDGLTTGALRLLEELGLDPGRVPNWMPCTEAVLRSPGGRQFVLPLPEGDGTFAAIAPRMELDAALVDLARSRGVEVLEDTAFVSVERNGPDEGVAISVDGPNGRRVLESDFLVAADGMWSPVRRAVGAGTTGYIGEWQAFRQYAHGVDGTAATQLHVWFEPDLLPGYAWSFPLPGNRVNFGFGMLRDSESARASMKDVWRDLPTRPHIAAALGPDVVFEDRHTAWPIPARVTSSTKHLGAILFVGDAACATDSLTGEGIGQALLSGVLAARAITGTRRASGVGRAYARSMRREFAADHRMSVVLGRVLASSFGARAALRIVDTTDFARRNFARWMFEDEPRAALLTPRRWHRRFLARPGAYSN